jgi:Tfp pilus assembly protein FimV
VRTPATREAAPAASSPLSGPTGPGTTQTPTGEPVAPHRQPQAAREGVSRKADTMDRQGRLASIARLRGMRSMVEAHLSGHRLGHKVDHMAAIKAEMGLPKRTTLSVLLRVLGEVLDFERKALNEAGQ